VTDEASLAAIRHIQELRGEIEFETSGVPVAVDLAGNRASAEGLDLSQLAALTTLTKLRLASSKISNADVPQLLKLGHLRELAVRNSQLGDSGFRQLAALPKLKTLDVQRSIRLTDDALQAVGEFPQLTDLVLVDNLFTNQGLTHLARAARLQSLDLRGCSQIDAVGLEQLKPLGELNTLKLRGDYLDAACLRLLSSFPKLASLTIEDAPLGDDDLAGLSVLPLEDLTLERCFNITDEGLRHFQSLHALGTLALRDIAILGPGLAHLAQLPELRTLRLRQTGIRDESLPLLQKLPHLERLDLVQALITDEGLIAIGKLRSLVQVDLEANQLSDAGLAHLAGLENLRTLSLAGNEGVTDQSFQVLASLSMLTSLDLSGTAVTDQGLTALKAALPNCRIVK
jgi:Leucine-rich repeat (LRR) protein